jgi:hypothetical protein
MTQHAHRQIGKLFRALMHVPVPWVFVLTYLVGVALEFVCFRSRTSSNTFLATDIGIILFLAGAALAAWGWLIFRKAKDKGSGRGFDDPSDLGAVSFHSKSDVSWAYYRVSRRGRDSQTNLACSSSAFDFCLSELDRHSGRRRKVAQVFAAQYEVYRTAVGRWF